jgi:carboxyl-terminal processing protease
VIDPNRKKVPDVAAGMELIGGVVAITGSACSGDSPQMTLATSKKTLTAIVLAASATLIGYGAAAAPLPANIPPRCELAVSSPPEQPPEMKPTTITTIGQAYFCIIDNYFGGPVLDNRSLLVSAFIGLTQELQRRGLDQLGATLPALTGKNERDWAAFSAAYENIEARLPPDAGVRQGIAEATMRSMVTGLNDNHARWQRGNTPNLSGISLSGFRGAVDVDPVATAPLFVTEVSGRAEAAGIRPGDEVLAVNGIPPFLNGTLAVGVINWITEMRRGTAVELTLRRPVMDTTFTVTLTAGPPSPPQPESPATLVGPTVGYAKLRGFDVASVDDMLAAIAALRATRPLSGVVLDLRGNGGGDPDAVARLTGAFVHDRVTGYWCNARGRCISVRTDDSVPLMNLRLVALTDRKCASACDHFAAAVRDLQLGALVGTRTAGIVSGPAERYLFEDGSSIQLPKFYGLAANGEVINEIGVAPHYYAPTTATDLSAGRDSALETAVGLLR